MKLEGLQHYFEYKGADIYRTEDFDQLPEGTQEYLFPHLEVVGSEGFSRPLTDRVREGIRGHVTNGDLFIVMNQLQVTAFARRKLHPEVSSVYLAGAVKLPSAPSGVVEEITRRYVEENNPTTVITRSQNDRVIDVMLGLCKEVIPVHRAPSNEEIGFLEHLGYFDSRVEKDTLITKKCYGRSLIVNADRRRSVNSYVRRVTDQLDYDAGDALLLLGYRQGGEK